MMFHVKRVRSDDPQVRAYQVRVSTPAAAAYSVDETTVFVDCICYWCATAVLDFQQLGERLRGADRARDDSPDDRVPELEL